MNKNEYKSNKSRKTDHQQSNKAQKGDPDKRSHKKPVRNSRGEQADSSAPSRGAQGGQGGERRPDRASSGARGRPTKSEARKIDRLSLFGMHAVREAWLNPLRQIDGLYITESMMKDFEPHIHAAKKAGLKRPEAVLVERARLNVSFPENTVHQGIALRTALLEEHTTFDVINAGEEQMKSSADGNGRSLIMILDQVTDPHNIGAVIRSASAFGITGMIVQKKHTPLLQGIVGKTACGGLDHLLIGHETNLSRSIDQLKGHGYYVIGLDERGEESLENFVPPQRCAFVLGAEGPGMRRLTKESCDQMLKLPTGGAVGSVNVSNAAAICLYALSTHKGS
jgi:23S rRNA (guanosine2251-2'-O)-methyltransferase